MAQCDATVDACLDCGVVQAPSISINVGVRLATQRVKASIAKHRQGLTKELAAGSVICLSPDDDDDDDDDATVGGASLLVLLTLLTLIDTIDTVDTVDTIDTN